MPTDRCNVLQRQAVLQIGCLFFYASFVYASNSKTPISAIHGHSTPAICGHLRAAVTIGLWIDRVNPHFVYISLNQLAADLDPFVLLE